MWGFLKRRKPKFHQVLVVVSNPFGEEVFPFQFTILDDVTEDEMSRLARVAWQALSVDHVLGFYTGVEVQVLKPTV